MSVIENEQIMTSAEDKAVGFQKKPTILIIAIVILVLAAASVVGYFVWNHMQQLEQARIEQALQEQQILEQKLEEERILYEQARSEVLIDQFYEGISINGVAIGGLSLDEAEDLLREEIADLKGEIEYSIKLGDQSWNYTASDIGFSHDLDKVIDEAWKIGRISGMQDEKSQIFDRQKIIQELSNDPVDLPLSFTYNSIKLNSSLRRLADEQNIEAVAAQVTGFDLGSKKFIVSQHSDGLEVSAENVISSIDQDFNKGVFTGSYELNSEVIPAPNADLAARVAGLGLISQAKTYASAPDAPRDNNIGLVTRAINGHVVMPGETFSFNGYIGKRTIEKGYQEAGAIFDGALIKSVGGGICQPNTTLYQAVLKADLNVIERRPHTYPSSYTDIGIDAAIDWGSQDMKFVNNTDYPIAIVSWYSKPEIVFQIYGRALPDGMSISLSTEVTANSPPEGPIETLVPTMQPGTRVQKRAPHNLIRARAWKVFTKNGEFVRSEEIFSSYYPPIRAKIDVGPPLPEVVEPEVTEPVVPPVAPETPAPVPETTETAAPAAA